MLSWVSLGLVLAAVAVGIHWYPRRVDGLGRPMAFPWVSVAVLVALAVATAAPGVVRTRHERRLAAAASALAGVQVGVRCQSFGGAFVDPGPELGFVRWRADGTPEPWTLIKRDQCRDLAAYLRSDKHRPSRAQVVAVHVLTHEAMHLSGRTDEAVAECAAVQRDAQTARLLGASAADAAGLAVAYWRHLYPLMPDGYRSTECGPGGALDERLPDAPWSPAQPSTGQVWTGSPVPWSSR